MTALKKSGIKKTAPKNRAAEISAARKAAFHILLSVERGQSHSDDLLRGKVVNALSAADRNLTTALVLGVLRWQILLDRQIHALLSRPNAKLDAEILIALRLGAFQLLHMDRIPARAAIDESVELAKQAGHRFASGMVNAVLRKLERSQHFEDKNSEVKGSEVKDSEVEDSEINDSALKGHDFSRAVSGSINTRALAPEGCLWEDLEAHPAWMVERWTSFYGLEGTRAICFHGQSQPSLTVRLSAPDVENELIAAGIVLEAGELLHAARTVVSGDLTATAAFRENRVRLQDEGSQLVAEILASNLTQDEKKVLDICAAPGGKTLILAERHPRARIVALESSAPRLEQLRKRLAPLGERIECRLADATALNEEANFDLALADVPCSGTGTLGRNPEIRHRLRLDDLARQAERQRAILSAALRALRPGGRAVYSTCSLEPEENEQVVAAVLAEAPFARLIPLADRIDALRKEGILTENGAKCLQASLTPEGCLRLLPGAFHTDGFFIALIEKIA
jgi:16S rRNA (cytosine967-C5)-methyltransferase